MIIIIDSREQKPLKFKKNSVVKEVIKQPIPIGKTRFSLDYGCKFKDGHIPAVFFERKEMTDLFGTLKTKDGYNRFRRKMKAAQEAGITIMLIVEGSLCDVLKGTKYSKVKGLEVVRSMFTIWFKYGVVPVFTSDRVDMVQYIVEFYHSMEKDYMRRKK